MNKIVAIGGTGQLVLHYYLQLYLLGVITDPFEAVVVDTDDLIRSLSAGSDFLADLQYGPEHNEALGAIVPAIEWVEVSSNDYNTVADALTGGYGFSDMTRHPMQAFFNRDTLVQNLSQGLYARPALSSVISQEKLQSEALIPQNDSVLAIVSSVLGGTGGGLTAPIIAQIQSHAKEVDVTMKLRAVIFGEYFNPDQKESKIERKRIQSNQTLVLRSLREALKDVHSFYIVGGPKAQLISRDAEQEKKGEQLPWPKEASDPIWHGMQALEYLFTETKMSGTDEFEKREVEVFDDPNDLAKANTRLKQRLLTVENLIKKEAVVRMAKDPWASLIWGAGFTRLIIHFWSIAARVEGGKERVADFPTKVQQALKTLWRGKEDQLGLGKLFPQLTESHPVRPKNLSKIGWPEVSGRLRFDPDLMGGVDEIARRAAATILFRVLREGV
ncbi:MAG: hypothetical protein SF097_24390 [Acidobacteriota bacterium]|nr:hypothetical protein [Acidobacteriota bacterium]